MELQGDLGRRREIRDRPDLVATLPRASVDGRPIDIDTPSDYERLQGITGTSSKES
jgi:CTP:molybdopterin cytidylyltransferase MocA